jgi:hypothetical protein
LSWSKRFGIVQGTLIKARHKPASIDAFPDILHPFRYSPRDTLR